jgi:hypothetical protein
MSYFEMIFTGAEGLYLESAYDDLMPVGLGSRCWGGGTGEKLELLD